MHVTKFKVGDMARITRTFTEVEFPKLKLLNDKYRVI